MNSPVMDNGAGNLNLKRNSAMPLNANAIDKKVSLEKTEQSRAVSGAVNAINGNAMTNTKAWHEGSCEYCHNPFQKKTTWQRFCCVEHQAIAYELRTGKKWKGKKVATAGG